MVGTLPDMILQKFDISVNEGGGCKDNKVFVNGALPNKPKPTTNKEGMETLSMVVLAIGRTCSGVVGPLGS